MHECLYNFGVDFALKDLFFISSPEPDSAKAFPSLGANILRIECADGSSVVLSTGAIETMDCGSKRHQYALNVSSMLGTGSVGHDGSFLISTLHVCSGSIRSEDDRASGVKFRHLPRTSLLLYQIWGRARDSSLTKAARKNLQLVQGVGLQVGAARAQEFTSYRGVGRVAHPDAELPVSTFAVHPRFDPVSESARPVLPVELC